MAKHKVCLLRFLRNKRNSKEKLVKCATKVARLHKVSVLSCTQSLASDCLIFA